MSLVPVPKPTFAEKLRRFFMTDLLKGLAVTLKLKSRAVASLAVKLDEVEHEVTAAFAAAHEPGRSPLQARLTLPLKPLKPRVEKAKLALRFG